LSKRKNSFPSAVECRGSGEKCCYNRY